MRVTIVKGSVDDRVEIRRADGSAAETRFPKKGPVPHEAALWSGGSDAASVRHMGEAGCAASHVDFPAITDAQIDAAMARVLAMHAEWSPAPVGHSLSFDWAAR